MEPRGRILVVDDEVNARTALAELLRDEGYTVETAADGFKALPKLEDFAPDLVVTDLRMPGMDGLQLLKKAHERDPDCGVIVMTAYGAVDTAVAAMREGAADYVTKPVNVEELVVVIDRALERRRVVAESRNLRERLSEHQRIDNIVGSSPVMRAVLNDVLRVAPSRATVLITGESGTGKELVAAAIHQHGARASGPFVKLHCAALAETLLESELFGHERGAFTGATARRDGRFQQADGGTLFLDEIGDISPSIQIKLLRFLQEHEFQRVGGNQTIKVDVRVVAATNRDLAARVRAGEFREDLYYRLNVVSIEVPPLRSRPTDIPLLAMYFLGRYAKENGKIVTRFSEEALERLVRHRWPGNVRELENAVERAVVISQGEVVRPEDLPNTVTPAPQESGMPQVPGASLADLERYAILKTLEFTGGSTSRAADILGISVRKIQYKLHEYQDAAKPAPELKKD
ncbi:MAG TPA: sigma-54 dependent transcriptional regulator [Candidatus Polarisedimenticolaceae bacterium]|nr:sigma-54 dependent transcriptional regulator [Candidatus Polarisedimenticolaceae bacterium]